MDVLFLDANIFFAATASNTGASHFLFELGEQKHLKLISSFYALQEARRNIEKKLGPDKINTFLRLVSCLSKIDKTETDDNETAKYQHLIVAKDLPILLSAQKMKADFLITLDKKDFKTPKLSNANLPFKIMLPGEYVQQFVR